MTCLAIGLHYPFHLGMVSWRDGAITQMVSALAIHCQEAAGVTVGAYKVDLSGPQHPWVYLLP